MKVIIQYIPNILSVIRLGLASWFPFSPSHLWPLIVIGGGLTDFFDGWIARRWNVTSWQGGLLDAVADKVFVLSVLTTYVLAGMFNVWWIPAVIARDLIVTLIAVYAVFEGAWGSFQKMDARWSGKIATAGQFLLLVTSPIATEIIPSVLLVSVLLSTIAAMDYGRQFRYELKKREMSVSS